MRHVRNIEYQQQGFAMRDLFNFLNKLGLNNSKPGTYRAGVAFVGFNHIEAYSG